MGSSLFDSECENCGRYQEYVRDGHECYCCGITYCDDCSENFIECECESCGYDMLCESCKCNHECIEP